MYLIECLRRLEDFGIMVRDSARKVGGIFVVAFCIIVLQRKGRVSERIDAVCGDHHSEIEERVAVESKAQMEPTRLFVRHRRVAFPLLTNASRVSNYHKDVSYHSFRCLKLQ